MALPMTRQSQQLITTLWFLPQRANDRGTTNSAMSSKQKFCCRQVSDVDHSPASPGRYWYVDLARERARRETHRAATTDNTVYSHVYS